MIIREDRKGTFRIYENADDPVEKAIGRQCVICKQMKVKNEMKIKLKLKDGMDTRCKLCSYEQNMDEKYREKRLQRGREYMKTRMKDPKNLKNMTDYMRDRYNNDPEFRKRQKDSSSKYQKNNLDRALIANHKRRAKIAKVDMGFTSIDWNLVQGNFNFMCPLSHKSDNINIEHFIPIAKNGLHCKTNIIPMDNSLNISKGAKNPFVWIQTQPEEYHPGFWKSVEYLANQNEMTVEEYTKFVESFFSK